MNRRRSSLPLRRFASIAAVVGAAALFVTACGGNQALAPVGTDEGRAAQIKKNTAEPTVAGYMFASVGERSIGPFFSRRGTGAAAAGLTAWVTVAEGSGRRVLVVPIDSRGSPRGGEMVVANVSVDTTMLVVRPMRGPAPGFVVAWTSLTDRGKSLWSVAVADDGSPRNKPVELTRTTDDIVWIDIVPTDHGAVCLWAEELRGGDANLLAAPLNTDGKVRGTPTRVATSIVGWHALELAGGIGLSTVAAVPLDAKSKPASETRLIRDARPGGALSFQRLDHDAHAIGQPFSITTKPIVSGDVEVVREGSRLVFAWTDRSGDEPAVAMASMDEPKSAHDKPKVEPARRVAEARGGAALLSLANGPAGTALMFEAPARRKGEVRRVHIGRVLPSLALERKPFSIEVVGRGQPELTATSTGFAMLATVADCEQDATSCLNANAVATVLRTDAKLEIVQREPLTFQTDPATLGWGITCEGETCFTLAASPGGSGTATRIRTAAIHPRTNASPIQPATRPTHDGPQIADITAVATGESILDMATTRLGDSTLVAMLSAATNVPKDPNEKKHAGLTLTTRLVGEGGETAAPFTITTKALQVGGVALAGAAKSDDGAALAWIARENGGDPQVHVTRLDKRGKRTADVQLTTSKGEASDVTITWAGNGWIVAWVDWRDGNGEVYATKIAPDLNRTSREERITNAPGDASDLVALAHGTDVWLAWADSRESPKDGVADVYVSAVRMQNAKRVFDEQRLLPTAAHSRTPHLIAAGNDADVHIAWIEEAPLGAETPSTSGYGAFWAKLDAAGKPAEKPQHIALAGDGAATSVALEIAEGSKLPRAVIARSSADAISLDAIDLSTSPPRTASLVALEGPPSLDVALILEGGILYFNDEGPRLADRRARRARIAWTTPPSAKR